MTHFDTIAAIITAVGKSAINVIRVSGENSIEIVNGIFKGKNLTKVKSHTVNYGFIYDEDKKIDEVLVSVFRSPKSYTEEDCVEISSHGGTFIVMKILDLLLRRGCRLANPGEFTERAFLNGRIDLSHAEAVMDVIESSTDEALSLAHKGLSGDVYKLVHSLRERLIKIIANIEINIDYPEYEDIEDLTSSKIKPEIVSLINDLTDVTKKAEIGRIYRDGIITTIVGKPNVGKSSLLNALIKEDKAIVTDIAGTTRDIVEGEINIGGIVLKLIDTAGIRETDNIVEKMGIDKSNKAIEEAELIILLLDSSKELTDEDKALLEKTKNKKRIIVGNKIDLGSKIKMNNIVPVSVIENKGLDILEEKIKSLFINEEITNINSLVISNVRHINLLKKALESLKSANSAIDSGDLIDMIEIDIKSAWNYLGEITGETTKDELLDELFGRFCVGK